MAADNVLSGNSHLADVTFLGLPPKTFYVFKEVRLHTPHPERFDERTFEDAVYSFTRAPERFTPEEQDAYRKEIDLRTNMSVLFLKARMEKQRSSSRKECAVLRPKASLLITYTFRRL